MTDTINAPAARCCQACAAPVVGRANKTFCDNACKTAFHNLQAKRGKVALPLLLAWTQGRHKNTEASRYARAELFTLASMWTREDRAAGRPPMAEYVQLKMDAGWRAVDLED